MFYFLLYNYITKKSEHCILSLLQVPLAKQLNLSTQLNWIGENKPKLQNRQQKTAKEALRAKQVGDFFFSPSTFYSGMGRKSLSPSGSRLTAKWKVGEFGKLQVIKSNKHEKYEKKRRSCLLFFFFQLQFIDNSCL